MLGLLHPKQSLTILTYDAIPQLSLADFWSWVETASIWFWQKPIGGNGAGKRPWKGSLILSDPPTYLTCRWNRKTLKIVDIRNYVQLPLLELLQAAGLRPNVYAHTPGGQLVSDECALEIAKALGVIYSKWLTRWRNNDCGVWQPTAARLAMNNYRHRTGKYNGFLEKQNKGKTIDQWFDVPLPQVIFSEDLEHKDFERQAYFAGRAECFRVGAVNEPVYYVDVRSMYPFVASQLYLPYAFARKVTCPTASRLLANHPYEQSIASVTVRVTEPLYPLRAWKGEKGIDGPIIPPAAANLKERETMVVFPTGEFQTVLCGEELAEAVVSGHVVAVHRALEYRCCKLFAVWMTHWHKERCWAETHGDRVYALLCKAMMNSLIGKYGQRSQAWIDRPDLPAKYQWGTDIVKSTRRAKPEYFRFIAGHVQQLGEPKEIQQSMIPIPAFVCSAARLILWEMLQTADLKNVLLCHTDGFIVTQKGLDNLEKFGLLGSDYWGQLRVTDSAQSCTIYDVSQYWFGSERVTSGFPTERQVTINGSNFGWVKQHCPTDPAKKLPGTFTMKLIHWSQAGKYFGRKVGENGLTEAWALEPEREVKRGKGGKQATPA